MIDVDSVDSALRIERSRTDGAPEALLLKQCVEGLPLGEDRAALAGQVERRGHRSAQITFLTIRLS